MEFPLSPVSGYFDQQFRATLFASWASHLQQANIHFRADLARVEVRELSGVITSGSLVLREESPCE